MAQDIVNNNQGISYTNLDFSSIYTETLDLIKKLTYRWDPSISDESDPGVILVKLSALIADKCNYNIDKSILEAFPLSVTQDANAQQLYEQLGYYMNWYESATAPVVLNWISATDSEPSDVKSYTIPKFTIITNEEETTNYALIGVEGSSGVVVSDGILTTDAKELRMVAMEGTPTAYSYLGQETVITSQMVDKDTHRIYFDTPWVSQNGIFITNTKQNNYADWKRVDNIYEQSYNELRYKFGYDSYANSCFIEFPDNYPELFGDGIEIVYMSIDETYNNIPAQGLERFLVGVTPIEDSSVLLNSSNVAIQNYAAASGHKEKESINEAYENYKKTVGTFKTLITLRDYLNYIRSSELDICSNAFVCDRTNDIQSTYKIVSKQHGLDSIIVKIEQIVDKTTLESNFDYKFEKTADENAIPGKPYYTIVNDKLYEVQDTIASNPKENGWYEFSSRVASTHDALTPFSLKFYLLSNSISLDSKNAFNETFEMSTRNIDIDSLLSDSAHLEHTYEDILPLGENTYKETSDEVFLKDKAYYTLNDDKIHYDLYTDYNIGDSVSTYTHIFYELDVEALLPHTVFFKNIYPLTVNISTYDSLNSETQETVQKNIINALYQNVNSSKLDFGEGISTDYLSEIITNSDDRIREVSFDSINYYTRAVYYDAKSKQFKEATIPSSVSDIPLSKTSFIKVRPNSVFEEGKEYYIKIDNMHYDIYTNYNPGDPISNTLPIYELDYDQKSEEKIIGKMIGRDVLCKSILAGTTYLLTPDDVFTFHLNQKFIEYFENISSITSQAVIDIGGKDCITTYSSDTANPYIRQSYTLKPNETISLYRPQLETIREFSSGIHYECFLYNDIKEGQSYELQKNEYVIFYQSYKSDSSNSDSTMPDGFNVYCCTKGVIISPSFDISAQTNFNSLTRYAQVKVIPYFDNNNDNWYETSTYSFGYVSEIYNNSSIINNVIKGTNTVKLQGIYSVDINVSDNYKFFWVLKNPKYSNDGTLKSYVLFPEYDVSTDRLSEREKNSYTLKNGEWLYYVDSSYSNLAILGAGTTIYRNCGITQDYDDDNANTCFSYIPISEFNSTSTNTRFKDGILETITSHDSVTDTDIVNPYANGWYIEVSEGEYERTTDTEVLDGVTYYVLVMDDNSGLYKRIGDAPPYEHSSTLQSSDVFSEVNSDNLMSNVNPDENGWYEIVTCMNSRVTDYYALSDGASYNNYLRYTKSLDQSILSRNIFTDANYDTVDISDTDTYQTITITNSNSSAFDYISQRLLVPSNGYESYKPYYQDSEGEIRITDIYVTSNPNDSQWYEEQDGEFVISEDTTPVLLSTPGSIKYPTSLTSDYCFEEVAIDTWLNNTISFKDNGYFYKTSTSSHDYEWDTQRTSDASQVTPKMLSHLLSLYISAYAKYHDDSDYEAILNYIALNWNTDVSYNDPFKTTNKAGWRTRTFRLALQEEEPEYIGISRDTYRQYYQQSLSSYEIYPNYSYSDEGYDVVLPIEAKDLIGGSEYAELVAVGYIEILDRTLPNVDADEILVDYISYLYSVFNNCLPNIFGMSYKGKVFRFKDLYRRTSKAYFTPNYYVTKIFDPIDSWSCVALDNDDIADDPINIIGDTQWQSLQPNTSLRIVQNEMWSFAEGDTLRFEAPVISQNSIAWPRFSNTEIPLDLNSYSISYQRKGQSIEELNRLILTGYEWQGYSHLLLNTSSNDGQKLESNHSLILYSFNDSNNLEKVATINGSDYENVTVQLKYPVDNIAGRYIDVTTQDVYGASIPNSVYEFIPLVNTDGMYTYNSDYTTFVKFNVDENPSEISREYKKTTDTDIDESKIYYKYVDTYTEVADPQGNPSENEYYEYDENEQIYVISIDTEVQQDKTYYTKEEVITQVDDPVVEDIDQYYELIINYDIHKIINTQVRIPLLLPKGRYLLPVYTETEGVRYWLSKYTKAVKNGITYAIDYSPTLSTDPTLLIRIGHNQDELQQPYGEHLYPFNKDKFVGLSNNNYYIQDNKYHYIDISIDADPQSEDFIKVSLPAHITEYYSKATGQSTSPSWFGWYEYVDGEYILSSDTGIADELLEEVVIDTDNYVSWLNNNNPSELHWYEYHQAEDDDNPNTTEYYYTLSTDESPVEGKTYYKDKDFYIKSKDVDSPVLKVNADNPFIDINSPSIYIVVEDVYKYKENLSYNNDTFNMIKKKIRELDDESLFNYAYRISSNDEIKDPLEPRYFFEGNHVFNKFTIPQLNFDELNLRFTTRNASRRY